MPSNFYPRSHKPPSPSRISVLPTSINDIASHTQPLHRRITRTLKSNKLIQYARRYNIAPIYTVLIVLLLLAVSLAAIILCSAYIVDNYCIDQTWFQCMGISKQSRYALQPVTANNLHMLIIHEFLPQPDLLGSDKRLINIIKLLQQNHVKVSIIGRADDNVEISGKMLDLFNIEYLAPLSSNTDIIDFILKHNVNAVLFTIWFWYSNQYKKLLSQINIVKQQIPQITVIGLSDDCHAVRELQFACDTNVVKYDSRSIQSYYNTYSVILPIEMHAYSMLDYLWTITDRDQQCIKQTFNTYNEDNQLSLTLPSMSSIHYVYPNELPQLNHQIDKQYDQRHDLIFVGYNDNIANLFSLYYFVDHIMPLINQRLPKVKLHIVGSSPTHKFKYWYNSDDELQVPNNVVLHGYVEADELQNLLLSTRIFVSSLRYGTGVNTKNILALMYGLPLVTTSLSAGGLPGTCAQVIDYSDNNRKSYTDADTFLYEQCNAMNEHQTENAQQFVQSNTTDPLYPCFVVANTAQSIADTIINIYSDDDKWFDLHVNAMHYAKQYFAQSILADELKHELPIIQQLIQNKFNANEIK